MNDNIQQTNIRNFINPTRIAEGAYGIVYRAYNIETNQYVALKKNYLHCQTEGVPYATLREMSLLKCLKHQNIVQLLDIIYCDPSIYLVFEYFDQDLRDLLQSNCSGLPASQAKSYLNQLLCGVEYCHNQRILHRDLSPNNLLVDDQGNIKITDFGLARCFSIPVRAYTEVIVTQHYRAPEILLGAKLYFTAVDIWSLGCIFVEILTGRTLFPGGCEMDQLYRIFKIMGTPDEKCWPHVENLPNYKPTFTKWAALDLAEYLPKLTKHELDLVSKMLIYFPQSRVSAGTALKHEYFNETVDEVSIN